MSGKTTHHQPPSLRLQYFLAACIYALVNGLLKIAERLLFQWTPPENPQTILIFRQGHLGDTLCAVPAFRAIRKRYPSARLILMTNAKTGGQPFSKDVLENIIDLDGLITYDPERIREKNYAKSLLSEIKKERVDLLIYLGVSIVWTARLFRDMLFFKLAGCKSACGFRLDTHRYFTRAQREYRRFEKEPERLMKLVEPLGISPDFNFNLPEVPFDFPPGFMAHRPLVAIHPGAKFPVKKWPIERFIQTACLLQNQFGASFVVIGGADCGGEAGQLEAALKKNSVLNLAGKTGLLESAQVLRQCDFLLSNDSGPVHIAAAVGIPVVGIYSARDFPNAWYPWGNNHEIMRKDVPCQICYLETCPIMICINQISVEEVVAACEKIIQKRAPAGARAGAR